MPVTPETLPRHELNGRRVAVVDAADPGLVGIAGRVVGETTRTLAIEGERDGESRVWTVPKSGTTFEFALVDEAAPDRETGGTASERPSEPAGDDAGGSDGCEGVAYVTVDGARLLSRPARRTERGGANTWRQD